MQTKYTGCWFVFKQNKWLWRLRYQDKQQKVKFKFYLVWVLKLKIYCCNVWPVFGHCITAVYRIRCCNRKKNKICPPHYRIEITERKMERKKKKRRRYLPPTETDSKIKVKKMTVEISTPKSRNFNDSGVIYLVDQDKMR